MSHKVMVIEDQEDIRDVLCRLLELEGHQVLGFENGRRALDYLRSGSPLPCLILLDLMMPVMDGYDFRDHQLADPRLRPIPVVVTSAYSPGTQVKGAPVLPKPLDFGKVLACVDSLCMS